MPHVAKTIIAFAVVMAFVIAIAWTIRRLRGAHRAEPSATVANDTDSGGGFAAKLTFGVVAALVVWKLHQSTGGQIGPTLAAVAAVTLAAFVMWKVLPSSGRRGG